MSKLAVLLDQRLYNTRSMWQSDQYIHAKCLIATGTSTTVLSGSHNLNTRGVSFGTVEIALMSTDEQLAGEIRDYIVSRHN